MRTNLLLLMLCLAFISNSQVTVNPTSTQNYVHKIVYKKGYTEAQLNTVPNDDKIETINYIDGLGRPLQTVGIRQGGKDASYNDSDIVTPFIYDGFGRQVQDYLPLPNSDNDGRFISDAINTIHNQYQILYPSDLDSNNPNPYSEKHFEASPLNRILEQGAPGEDWMVDESVNSDHTIKFEYESNTTSDEVKKFIVGFPYFSTEKPQLYYNGYYAANELYKTVTKDENWQPNQNYSNDHSTIEFKDKQGRVVLKRTYNEDVEHNTYYVYDDFGNLTYVLPPKGSDVTLTQNVLTNFNQTIKASAFQHKGPQVTGNAIVDLVGNQLTVTFNLSISTAGYLKKGAIKLLNQPLPNMIIGSIPSSTNDYIVSIQDGYLHLSNGGTLNIASGTFTVTVPEYDVDLDEIDKLCYQYHYDYRNRLIEKKIPGKGWEFIAYDNLDRPVMTQDSIQRENNQWLFTKYDALGRVVYTGLKGSASERRSIQNALLAESTFNESKLSSGITVGDNTTVFYSNNSYPTLSSYDKVYTINYYDNHNFDKGNLTTPSSVYGIVPTSDTHSLATGTKVRVLGTDDWITTITFYDDKNRPIYVASENEYLETTDIIENDLDDFNGRLIQSKATHSKTGHSTVITIDDFEYDHVGRLIEQVQTINGQTPEAISSNYYDELGQLVKKGIGNSSDGPLQTVDYNYNIRGWLKSINDVNTLGFDLFGFKINYNSTDALGSSAPLFNGNISETFWKTASNDGSSGLSGKLLGYYFNYDALNRLKKSRFLEDNILTETHKFDSDYVYDKNGNILSLERSGLSGSVFTGIDELVYTYNGNQLTGVEDLEGKNEGFNDVNTTGNDFSYDGNGNLYTDANKDITGIDYNHLNLPVKVSVDFDSDGHIEYIYDASGVKLAKMVYEDEILMSTTNYAGNYVYNDLPSIGEELQFFNHPEGYAEPVDPGNLSLGFKYVYQYKDHLGNIRLSYSKGTYESLVYSSFYENYDGWSFSGGSANGSIEIEGGLLKVNVKNHYNGAVITVGENFSPGDQIEITFNFDTGDTDKVRVFLNERMADNTHISWHMLNSDVQTGSYTYNHTITTGPVLKLKFDKSNFSNDVGTDTHFLVDDLFAHTGELEIREENNYYPFGLKHKGYNNTIVGTDHPYGYNGKEEQEELGLDWHDFGARNYDASLGRWSSIDPLAGKWHEFSPYNHTLNNPIFFVDPNGEDVYLYYYVESDNEADNSMFWNAALTRAIGMLKNMGENDTFKITAIDDLGELEEKVESDVEELSPDFGKTREFGIFSHAGLDGPIGSKPTSKNPLYRAGDLNQDGRPVANNSTQMSIAGWGQIDFNWADGGNNCAANFFGCNTANDIDGNGPRRSFTNTLSTLVNFRNVDVSGQSTSSYPSKYTNVRESNAKMRSGNFDNQRVYMVAAGRLGLTGRWLAERANPMIMSRNGETIKPFYQAGEVKPEDD